MVSHSIKHFIISRADSSTNTIIHQSVVENTSNFKPPTATNTDDTQGLELHEFQKIVKIGSTAATEENIVNCDLILNSDFIKQYLKVYDHCSVESQRFLSLSLVLITIVAFCGWYAITCWIEVFAVNSDEVENNFKGLLIYWAIFFTFALFYQGLYAVCGMYSGILWTEFFEHNVRDEINRVIDMLLNNRTQFDQSFVMLDKYAKNSQRSAVDGHKLSQVSSISKNSLNCNYDTETVVNMNISNMRDYSKQGACLEKLNRFARILQDKPCIFSILGVPVNRESAKVFVIGFVVSKIISLMWNTVHLD